MNELSTHTPSHTAPRRRIYRRTSERVIGGVCAGIAQYVDADAILIRALSVLLFVATFGVAGIVYLVLWKKIPLIVFDGGIYDTHAVGQTSTSRVRVPYREIFIVGMLLSVLFGIGATLFSLAYHIPIYTLWPLALLALSFVLFMYAAYSTTPYVVVAAGVCFLIATFAALPYTIGVVSIDLLTENARALLRTAFVVGVLLILGAHYDNDALSFAGIAIIVGFGIVLLAVSYNAADFSTLSGTGSIEFIDMLGARISKFVSSILPPRV